MEGLFCECQNLKTLPDISKWNTSKVENTTGIFYKCSSLNILPDIWKWDTKNVVYMKYIFFGCSSLKEIKNLDKWNTGNVLNYEGIIEECYSLKYLPKFNFNDGEKNNNSSIPILCNLDNLLSLLENSMSYISDYISDSNLSFIFSNSKNSNFKERNFKSNISFSFLENKSFVNSENDDTKNEYYEHFYD